MGGIETKHSAATTPQPPLLFDALEWRSKVEFRAAAPSARPRPDCTAYWKSRT